MDEGQGPHGQRGGGEEEGPGLAAVRDAAARRDAGEPDAEEHRSGVEEHHDGLGAREAPVDLALGWGPMSDSAVLAEIAIHQRHRFYYWLTVTFPIPRRDIETHSANMHLIPVSRAVADRLKSARPGHIVNLSGYLVEAHHDDGRRWRSSLTREDTGDGACELVWVETVTLR